MGDLKTHIFEVVKSINKFPELAKLIEEKYVYTVDDCYKYGIYQEALFLIKHDYSAGLMLSVLKAENEDRKGFAAMLVKFLSVNKLSPKYAEPVVTIKANLRFAYCLAELDAYIDYLETGEKFAGTTIDISTLKMLNAVKDSYDVDKTKIFNTKMQLSASEKDMQSIEALSKLNSKLLAVELVSLYKRLGESR